MRIADIVKGLGAAVFFFLLSGLFSAQATQAGQAGERDGNFILIASTTSTEQSGLFAYILPRFEAASGIGARVVAVGTGQALRLGQRGDADVLFVHDKIAEERFVAEGFGVGRRDVMYNDFVIIGPRSDPAAIAQLGDVGAALRAIASARAAFVSRGDDSGTHKAELRLWAAAGIDSAQLRADRGDNRWYFETGSGMGPALNSAAELNAYLLSDRATWLNFSNRRDLTIAFQGDPRLYNQYGVILVNPARHPHVKEKLGRAFIDWITGPHGQAAIAAYRIGNDQLFFPNAR
ncbi:MAG TPA: hypothetical protein DCO73_02590 [Alphaproteobacteria bacterium]|nr:hypothetical protein [Alphaproteobacteria bacterium]